MRWIPMSLTPCTMCRPGSFRRVAETCVRQLIDSVRQQYRAKWRHVPLALQVLPAAIPVQTHTQCPPVSFAWNSTSISLAAYRVLRA